jgi:putative component of toxin-antitoxin plasmid stabilization module
MDHKVIIKNFEDNDPLDDKLDLEILYVGNMNEAIPAKETVTIWENSIGIGPQYRMYFNRENDMVGPWGADPAYRWYLRI